MRVSLRGEGGVDTFQPYPRFVGDRGQGRVAHDRHHGDGVNDRDDAMLVIGGIDGDVAGQQKPHIQGRTQRAVGQGGVSRAEDGILAEVHVDLFA